MEIKFLGGAEEVGKVGALIRPEPMTTLLFDYGFLPSNPPEYPEKAPKVDMAFLTHGHLDHSGLMPWLASNYGVGIFASPPTRALMELLTYDALKVAKREGYGSPYSKEDIALAMGRTKRIGDGVVVGDFLIRGHDAGHIPGSMMFTIEGDSLTLFSGDINDRDTRLLRGTRPIKCNLLLIESTYAGRDHPPRADVENRFLAGIDEIVDKHGLAVVPAFAVGRAQELLLLLHNRGYRVCMDGMGIKATRMINSFKSYIRDADRLEEAFEGVEKVRSGYDRKKALKAELVLTTSGMLDGGPVLWYLDKIKDDTKSGVFLTGYQVEGSKGRRLMEEGVIDLNGVLSSLKCKVDYFDFSAHADHRGLVRFIKGCDPEKVILFHGDQREKICEDLEGKYEVLLPKDGEVVNIDFSDLI
jgi:putative mRNA 3-end processing factor